MLMPVPAVNVCAPGKVWPAAKVINPFLSIFSFGEIVPRVGPNWKLKLPSTKACNCAVWETLLASLAFRRNRFEACEAALLSGPRACVPVKRLPPARFAFVLVSVVSAAVARVVSAVIAELRLPSAVIARVVSPAIAVFRVFRSLVKPVTWFSLTLPVIVLAVPVTLPLIGLLNVFVPVQLLFAPSRLEFAEVMSDRNANDCVALFLSSNCRWMSLFNSQMSPKAGFDGTAPVSGTFNEAYPAADGASFWAPPVNMLPPARLAFVLVSVVSAAVARVVSAVM